MSVGWPLNLPVTVSLAVFANEDALLLKVDSEPFDRGNRSVDGLFQCLLCNVWVINDSLDDRELFQ